MLINERKASTRAFSLVIKQGLEIRANKQARFLEGQRQICLPSPGIAALPLAKHNPRRRGAASFIIVHECSINTRESDFSNISRFALITPLLRDSKFAAGFLTSHPEPPPIDPGAIA